MTDRVLQWGRTKDSTRIHLVIDNKRQCFTGTSRGKPQPIIQVFPGWDKDDPLTCPVCRERYFWLSKGAVSVKLARGVKTP